MLSSPAAGSLNGVIDYVAAVRAESARFHEMVAATPLDAPVASCPGWTMADLTWHLAEVQYHWAGIVADLLQSPADLADLDRPPDPELPALFVNHSTRLVDALARRDPGDECWSWHDDGHSVGWVRRRQAHEALIHRVDAELAASGRSPIDPELAADGVDEVIRVFLDASQLPDWSRFVPDGRTAVVALADAAASWALELGRFVGTSPNTGNTYDEEATRLVDAPQQPDAIVRGTAADVDLWMWGRGGLDQLTVEGDPEVAAFLRAAAVHGTQ